MTRLFDSLFNMLAVVGVFALALLTAPASTTASAFERASVPADCGLYAYAAKITEVYDGDTVTADVDLGFKTWRRDEKLRLFGIDAPEVRGESRPAGLVSRNALRERVLGQDVIVCTIKDKTGKYGRYLAEIFLGDENINRWLVTAGHAVPYGDVALSGTGPAGTDFERAALAGVAEPES